MDLKPIPQHTERGIPLLRIIWEQIKADMEAWEQDSWYGVSWEALAAPAVREYIAERKVIPWSCGTPACIAGHASFAAGATLPPRIVELMAEGKPSVGGEIITPDGVEMWVQDYAREVLGFTDEQADVLFAAPRTADEIEHMVTALEGDPRADLHYLIDDPDEDGD